jgi:hypothetical protein
MEAAFAKHGLVPVGVKVGGDLSRLTYRSAAIRTVNHAAAAQVYRALVCHERRSCLWYLGDQAIQEQRGRC